MTNHTFPSELAAKQDSKYFTSMSADNAVKGELQGGYVHTRPSTTRKPIKSYTTGFTDIDYPLYQQLESFYDAVGTHTAFDWTHPVTNVVIPVRFSAPFEGKYVGAGGLHRMDVSSIKLDEV